MGQTTFSGPIRSLNGFEAVGGDFDVTAGDIEAVAGDIVATAGDVIVTVGDATISAGELNIGSSSVNETEAGYLDSATTANSAASKAAILDASKRMVTNAHVGTAGTNCTVAHYGDGISNTAVITLAAVDLTIGDNADLAAGALIYTLPAGVVSVHRATMNVAISATDVANQSDTPELGLGTVIGTGAVAVLGGTATFEDILAGTAAADANGTDLLVAVNTPLAIASGSAHTVHLNIADGWADGTDQTATASGTVVIEYSFIE